MQQIRTELFGLLKKALQELAQQGKKQWFTHSDIAHQLAVESGRLNDTRKDALVKMARMGEVEFRYRPNDARKTHEYRPAKHRRARKTAAAQAKQATDAVFLEDNLYTALFAYLNRSLPAEDQPPHYMQYVPNDLSAEGWLDEARELAFRLSKLHHIKVHNDLKQIVAWVDSKQFQKAYAYLVERKQQVKSMIAEMDA